MSYDAIVIGSRCAGAPTAMLLARKGHRVLVVDRTTMPSDVLSGHAIQPGGVAYLKKWGLLERVRATGVPFTSKVRFDFGPVVLEGEATPIDGINETVCIRRTILDTLLTDAAAEAGAEVRHGFSVSELLWDGERVVGIRGRDHTGAVVEEHASVVIGADGVHSMVARAVNAHRYNEVPAACVNAYSYWKGVDIDATELYVRPGRFVVAVPTNDDLVIIAQGAPRSDEALYRNDVETAFTQTLAMVPHLGDRVAKAERVERFRFWTTTEGFFRMPAGPGWALVGDAGYHKDAITAQGMLDAFRDAELLADAIDTGDMVGYQRKRDEAALPMYGLTCTLAQVDQPPAPEMLQLIGALATNPEQTARFFGLIAGSVRVEDFMHPDNIGSIVAGAAPVAA
jgi:flavin-dependent dehydrogenase